MRLVVVCMLGSAMAFAPAARPIGRRAERLRMALSEEEAAAVQEASRNVKWFKKAMLAAKGGSAVVESFPAEVWAGIREDYPNLVAATDDDIAAAFRELLAAEQAAEAARPNARDAFSFGDALKGVVPLAAVAVVAVFANSFTGCDSPFANVDACAEQRDRASGELRSFSRPLATSTDPTCAHTHAPTSRSPLPHRHRARHSYPALSHYDAGPVGREARQLPGAREGVQPVTLPGVLPETSRRRAAGGDPAAHCSHTHVA